MPRSGWVKPVSDRRLSDLVSVSLLTRVFPADVVDQVIADAGRTEQRNRSLPARVMACFSIGMALYSQGSYEDVFARRTDGLAWSSGWAASWSLPSKSAIFQARESEFGGGVLLCQLLAGQSVGLRKNCLALIIEVMREHAELRTMGIRINSHSLIFPGGEDASQGTLTMACPYAGR